jgi:uncharacterized protein YxjI
MSHMNIFAIAAVLAFAQDLPTLSQFKEALAQAPVPATVAAAPQAAGAAQAAAPVLPAKFKVDERILSWTTTFDIKDDNKTYGVVTQKFFSLARAFTYDDAQGKCVAKARQRILSWGSHVDVTDCADRPIGSIKEEVMKSLFKVHTTYAILDASGKEVAKSVKVDWIGTEVTLTAGGRQIAKLTRPWLQWFSDSWDVEVSDATAADTRLIVMIAAYKTSVDNERRREEAEDDDK